MTAGAGEAEVAARAEWVLVQPMSPVERQRQLVQEFGFIEDRQERLAALVDRARQQPRLTVEERTDANLVPGCSSRVWLIAGVYEGRCRFRTDCDSPLVRGLVSVLVNTYDNATPEEVIATEPTLLADLGLWRDLSPTRQNGLLAVRRRVVELADALRRS